VVNAFELDAPIFAYPGGFQPPGGGQPSDMKLAFIPISILGGLVAGFIGQKAFDAIWGRVDEQEPPQPEHREVSLAKLAIALLIEGAIFRLVKGLFDHAARRGFARMTGSWPGEERPEQA
jgi:Protein of unknown function (DUF4235)